MEGAKCWANGCENVGTYECGRCQTAVYCSTQCQMTDWRAHAAACVEGIGERAAVAAAQIPDELEHALEEHPHAPVGWSCPRIGSVGGLPRLTWAEYLVEVHNHAVFEDEGRRSRVREGLEAACANPFLADAHAEMWKHLPGATWVAAQHTYSEALDDETRATYAKYSCDHTHISRELKTAVGRTAAHGPASKTDFVVWRAVRSYAEGVGPGPNRLLAAVRTGRFEHDGPVITSLYSGIAAGEAADAGVPYYVIVLRILVRAGIPTLAAVGMPMSIGPDGELGPYVSSEAEVVLVPQRLTLENVRRERLAFVDGNGDISAVETLVADATI